MAKLGRKLIGKRRRVVLATSVDPRTLKTIKQLARKSDKKYSLGIVVDGVINHCIKTKYRIK